MSLYREHAVVLRTHKLGEADRIVVLRLGRNNGIFLPDASNEELVGAITGAVDNSVSRRAERLREHAGSAAGRQA